ncbi:MAG TPA: hypothetical protein DCE42_13845, partial [Myxococcales bacterium]|nr:hypothetical protein [Myxococcales bacterium]
MDPLAGYQLQSYRLLHQVGSGGMGAVYKAEHRQNHAHYAIKILHPAYSQDEVMVERLRREAMLASQLQHHNIVQIYDHGWDTNVGFYMVMELLIGRGLDQLIEQEPILPVSRVAGVIYQVCDALEVAHSVGVIHRDLKPANVFLMRSAEGYELVKLVDFGIARIENAKGQALTQMGKHFGTPEYMPPEQILAQRENMGPATDIYSLAVLIFKMLTGRLPFVSKSLVGMMNLVMFRSPPPLSKLQPRFQNTQLERLLFQCMAKKPENRVQDIATFRHRFWEAIEQDPLMRPMLDAHHQQLWKLRDYEPLPDDSIGYGEDTEHSNTTDHSLENGMLEDGQSFQFGDDEYQIQGDEVVSATAVHPAFSTMLDDDDDCPTMINRSVTPGHSPHHLSVAEDEQQDSWAAELLHRDETFDEGDPTLIPTSTNHLKMTKPVGSSPLA